MVYPSHPPRSQSQRLTSKPLIAASLAIVLATLMVDFDTLKKLLPSAKKSASQVSCNTVISEEAILSRAQLATLLTIPERDAKSRIREIVSEPYCQLPSINVRAGVEAEREAYPLAFDPGTTLVILYENNEYAGYRFSFE